MKKRMNVLFIILVVLLCAFCISCTGNSHSSIESAKPLAPTITQSLGEQQSAQIEVPPASSKLSGGQTIYTVYFQTNGGDTIAAAAVESGAQLTPPAIPEKNGSSFVDWYTDNYFFDNLYDFSNPVTGSFTLYAKWQPIDYIISYVVSQDYGSPIELPNEPTRVGYTFDGWYLDTSFDTLFDMQTMPAEDITVYAKWLKNTYTMVFMVDDAVYSMTIDLFGQPIVPPAIPSGADGYVFANWEKDGSAYTLNYMPAEDITLCAAWDTIEYAITYHVNGGENSASNALTYNVESATITLQPAAKYGNAFLGWYKNAEFSGNAISKILTGSFGDISLYAKWALEQYPIIYNLNGGTNAAENPTEYTINDTIIFAPASREGYVFSGWYLDSLFSQAVTTIEPNSIGSVEIFAAWQADLTAYNQALNSVTEQDYTAASWSAYQAIAAQNVVDENDTAESVAIATGAILNAQSTLLVAVSDISVTASISVIGADVKLSNINGGYILESQGGFDTEISNGAALINEFVFSDQTSINSYGYTLNNGYQWLAYGKCLVVENLSQNAAMLKSITITYDSGIAVSVYDYGKAYIYADKLHCGIGGFDGSNLVAGSTMLQPQESADGNSMMIALSAHLLSDESGFYDFEVVMEWEEIVYGSIMRDPGNTGGELETLIEGDSITFSGEIDWYPEEADRARGNRVGVQINAPIGFDATEAQVTIGENTYSTLFADKDYFWWYPLVTEAGQSFSATVVWNSSSMQTFFVNIDQTSTLQAALNDIIFNKNDDGATGEMGIQQMREGETDILTANTFEKTGYSFAGWATMPGGEIAFLDGADYTMGAQPINNLYAVWSINTYTITYNLNYNYEEELSLINPTRQGYDFCGWYLEPEFLTQYDSATMPMQNITLYAKWVAITDRLAAKFNELTNGYYNTAFPENPLSYAQGAGEETYFTYAFHNDYNDLIVSVLYLRSLAYCFNFLTAQDAADFCSDLNNTLPEDFNVYVDGKYVYCATELGYDVLNRELLVHEDFYYLQRAENLTAVRYDGTETAVTIPETVNGQTVASVAKDTFTGKDVDSITIPQSITVIAGGMDGMTKLRHSFDGWYIDEALSVEFDFLLPLTQPVTIHAKWIDMLLYLYENSLLVQGMKDDAKYITDEMVLLEQQIAQNTSTLISALWIEDVFSAFNYSNENDIDYIIARFETYSLSEYTYIKYKGLALAYKGNFDISYLFDMHEYQGFYYVEREEECLLLSYMGGDETVNIPTFIGTKPVTKIMPMCFIYSAIKTVNIPHTIKVIGDYAFQYCSSLETVNISSNSRLYEIGEAAFHSCSSLSTIYFPSTLSSIKDSAFSECSSLMSVVLNANTNKIGNGVFKETAITSIFIPNTVVEIGAEAFASCRNLTEVIFEDGSILDIIVSGAFADTAITTITIPDSVTTICNETFDFCYQLGEIVFSPNSMLDKVGEFAFYSTLWESSQTGENIYISKVYYQYKGGDDTAVIISEGTLGIADSAFASHFNLTVHVPASVSFIGNAFRGSTLVVVDENNPYYKSINGALYDKAGTKAFYYPETAPIELIDGLETIEYGFAYRTDITTITIPSSVKYIEHGAFSGCINLQEVIFEEGSSLLSIGNSAFYGCASLISINLRVAKQLKHVGDSAFYGCANLISINLTAAIQLQYIGDYAFFESGLVEISLPYSVKHIGDYAFSYLNISSIVLPFALSYIGEGAFRQTALTEVMIPANVSYIGGYAFDGCEFLTSVTYQSGSKLKFILTGTFESLPIMNIPESLRVLSGCRALNEYNVHPNNQHYKAINGILYNKDATGILDYPSQKEDEYFAIPQGVVYAWMYGNEFLKTVEVSDTVISLSLGGSMLNTIIFAENGQLRQVEIVGDKITYLALPDSIKNLQRGAIGSCRNLADLILPQYLEVIEGNAIDGAMVSIDIPATVKFIGINAISSPNLESINVHPGNAYYKTINGVVYSKDGTTLISYPANKSGSEFYIPSHVNKIYGYAFANCKNLITLHIPAGVVEIGENAFWNSSLNTVYLESGVSKVWEYAFAECNNLKTIYIPASVSEIEDNAFYGCNNLSNIIVDENNTDFVVEDGILFTYGMTEFVFSSDYLYDYHLPLSVVVVRANAIRASRLYIHNTETMVQVNGDNQLEVIYVPLALYEEYCSAHSHTYLNFQRITVYFDYNGYTCEQYLDYGDTATEPEIPVREGYVFKGWRQGYSDEETYDFSEQVTYSISLYAKWVALYEVVFISDGEVIACGEVESGTVLGAFPELEKDGFVFKGWYLNNTLYSSGQPVYHDMEILAKWTELFTVDFISDDETFISINIEEGEMVGHPGYPVKEGYKFKGWYLNNELYSFGDPAIEDLVLQARWVELFTVSFMFQDWPIILMEVEDGEILVQPEDPVIENCIFEGWYADEEFTQPYSFGSAIVEDISLYAKWSEKQ